MSCRCAQICDLQVPAIAILMLLLRRLPTPDGWYAAINDVLVAACISIQLSSIAGCYTYASWLKSLNISLVCNRSKASVSTGAEVLPAEKDIQLGALQDCNTQMLQVTPFRQTWPHCFPVSCSASPTCTRHAMAMGSQLIWHCIVQAAWLVIVANKL